MVGWPMHQRERHRRDEAEEQREEPPPPRRGADAVLALQQAIGNQGTARLLARQKDKSRPSFEHSVKIGKLGPVEITGGNVGDWAAKKDADGLTVISVSGKHSAELKRLFDTKARIDKVETSSVVGENSLVTITFGSCRIKRFTTDDTSDEWMMEFETAKRHTLSIGAARP
jgi:hypothetical protein